MLKSAADDARQYKIMQEWKRGATSDERCGRWVLALVTHSICIGSGGKPQDVTVKYINICDLIKSIRCERLNCG